MRLTRQQTEAIRQAAHQVFGADAGVWLFGSRVDDSKRGGDIDLLHLSVSERRSAILCRHPRQYRVGKVLPTYGPGERKIDILIETLDDPRPIVRVAHQTGVRL